MTAVMLSTFAFSSCQKHQDVVPADSTPVETLKADVGVVNGMLAFKSAGIYDTHLEKMKNIPANVDETQFLTKLETDLGFESKRSLVANKVSSPNGRTLADEGILDEHLASILNKDNMVQIDKWIFKLDLKGKKCYVLPTKYATGELLEKMKSNNPAGEKVMLYSTEEDVLDLLAENKTSSMKSGKVNGLFGNDAKLDYYAYYDQATGVIYDNDDRGKMDCKVVYQRAAIYFSLQAKIKYHVKTSSGLYIQTQAPLCIDYVVIKFDSKRNSIGERDYSGRANDCDFDPEVSHRPYENIRGLNKYWYEVIFSMGGSGTIGGGLAIYVRNFGIKDGY